MQLSVSAASISNFLSSVHHIYLIGLSDQLAKKIQLFSYYCKRLSHSLSVDPCFLVDLYRYFLLLLPISFSYSVSMEMILCAVLYIGSSEPPIELQRELDL